MTDTKRPMIRIHDSATNEIIDREMTEAEAAHHAAQLEVAAAQRAQLENQAATKAALLERLGITAEEAALLLA